MSESPTSPTERHARAKAIFLAARELSGAARQQHLASACAGDDELAADVQSLLEHDHTATLLPRGDLAGEATAAARAPTASESSAGRASKSPAGCASDSPAAVVLPWSRVARGVLRVHRVALALALLAVVVLVVVALGVRQRAVARIEQSVESLLDTLLDADTEALALWAEREQERVAAWAGHPELVERVAALLDETAGATDEAGLAARLAASEHRLRLLELLLPLEIDLEGGLGYRGFGLIDVGGRLLAASLPDRAGAEDAVGRAVAPEGRALLARVEAGQTLLQLAFRSAPLVPSAASAVAEPLMLALAPVRREGAVCAALVFVLHPERDFTRILNLAQLGDSGETYAFDREGYMISESRYGDQLRAAGLIPPDAQSTAAWNLKLHDPGGDITQGFQPGPELARRPLTAMARAALAGESGVDARGYADYRGVTVVGAWRWLPEYDIGVATEIDRVEAYESLDDIRRAFGWLLGLLVAATLGALAAAFRLRMAQRRVTRFGQYTLVEKLGEGGMGAVWRAQHALLQRPVALKLIRHDRLTPVNLARFEREVQLTSRLTHPNTIEIFDYGHTDDGTGFFYAMEYLPGLSLARLVAEHGPQPPARVVHLLAQVCGSLSEAHQRGLVHRDVKPANLVLCERGLVFDVVKVLDFGLVKEIGTGRDDITEPGLIGGTPLYIAPETLADAHAIDGRSDLYAVGCVAYTLLTGEPVFDAGSWPALLAAILEQPAPAPSSRANQQIPAELDRLVVALLAKDPDDRPASAAEVVERLEVLAQQLPWTQAQARAWWAQHGVAAPASAGS